MTESINVTTISTIILICYKQIVLGKSEMLSRLSFETFLMNLSSSNNNL